MINIILQSSRAAVNTTTITLEGDGLEDVTSFTCLGSSVDKQGVIDADVKVRIGRARAVFLQIKNIGASPNLTVNIKIRIFNTTVKPALLYGAATWRNTAATVKKIQTFINTCTRLILRIRWPETISNRELWKRTKRQPAEDEIPQRRYRRIGHIPGKPMTCITRQALTWKPQGKRNRDRPRNTCRRDQEVYTEKMVCNWGQLERLAQDRDAWRARVGGLCTSGTKGDDDGDGDDNDDDDDDDDNDDDNLRDWPRIGMPAELL